MTMNIIADDVFLITGPQAKGTLRIKLGQPIQKPEQGWLCPFRIEGLTIDPDFSMVGDSSMHALTLSIKFIVTFLSNQIEDRHLLLAYSDGTNCDISDLRSRFGTV